MKKRMLFLLFVFIFAFATVEAQNKEFTYEDIIYNSYGKLAPKTLGMLAWDKEHPRYYWVENDTLFTESVAGNRLSFSLQMLNEIVKADSMNPFTRFPQIEAMRGNQILFWNDTDFVSLNMKERAAAIVFSVPLTAENIVLSPDFTMAAFTIKNNLYYVDYDGVKQITVEENQDIVCGQSVSRNEFGISGGIFWSPKSDKIAFYKKDVSRVTDYPVLDLSKRPATVKFVKYPMDGMKSEILSVGIYDLKKGNILFLKTEGEPEQYLASLTWGPEEEFFYVAHLNRLQNHLQLKKYSAKNGSLVATLFEEESEKYVEPEHPLYFLNKNEFLWFSERDGWQHLYRYDVNGNLVKQITHGEWETLELVSVWNDEILISATKESPLEKHYYLVNVNSGEIKKLTDAPGQHRVLASPEGKYFLDSFSSVTVPRKINLLNKNGEVLKTLLVSDNPIQNYALGERKFFTIENNGVTLYCRMILPVNFDETKKYPVIVYVYGGPHVQLVKNSWPFGRYDFWFYKMAQNGYIVFTLDNRGSANRGLEFEQATWHKLGTVEIQDQLAGVNYLKTLSYVDSSRFGVFGWSYGGYMTTSLMLRTNNTFKVGVAGGAVIDWRYYEIMYGERYMGTEATNHEGMENASLLNYVENLNGNLLMVHGTSDDVVVWQHTLLFLQKATHLNKELDYYPYVGHKHGVYGKDAVNLYKKITEYFFEHL